MFARNKETKAKSDSAETDEISLARWVCVSGHEEQWKERAQVNHFPRRAKDFFPGCRLGFRCCAINNAESSGALLTSFHETVRTVYAMFLSCPAKMENLRNSTKLRALYLNNKLVHHVGLTSLSGRFISGLHGPAERYINRTYDRYEKKSDKPTEYSDALSYRIALSVAKTVA